uniref:C2H2-type domain-containing protein n=1 Tax=Oryzias latipes TaxID=8090 RepID=A0A3P9JPI4_ORYLA
MKTHSGDIVFWQKTQYSCEICQKTLSERCNLKMHMRIHSDERPFSCKVCRKSFGQSSYLENHMTTHTNERPFTCKTCGRSFCLRNSLAAHLITHRSQRPFPCKFCGKHFHRGNSLTVHVRTHTGEQPFFWKTCHEGFTQSRSLAVHMRTHLNKLPFKCKTCGRSFLLRNSLKLCGKGFTHNCHLIDGMSERAHENSHRREVVSLQSLRQRFQPRRPSGNSRDDPQGREALYKWLDHSHEDSHETFAVKKNIFLFKLEINCSELRALLCTDQCCPSPVWNVLRNHKKSWDSSIDCV